MTGAAPSNGPRARVRLRRVPRRPPGLRQGLDAAERRRGRRPDDPTKARSGRALPVRPGALMDRPLKRHGSRNETKSGPGIRSCPSGATTGLHSTPRSHANGARLTSTDRRIPAPERPRPLSQAARCPPSLEKPPDTENCVPGSNEVKSCDRAHCPTRRSSGSGRLLSIHPRRAPPIDVAPPLTPANRRHAGRTEEPLRRRPTTPQAASSSVRRGSRADFARDAEQQRTIQVVDLDQRFCGQLAR